MMKIGDCAGCVSDCTAALEIIPGAFRPLLKRAEAYETSEKYANFPNGSILVCVLNPGMVSAVVSRSCSPSLNPGQIVRCPWARHFTLAVPPSTQVYNGYHLGCSGNMSSSVMAQEPG